MASFKGKEFKKVSGDISFELTTYVARGVTSESKQRQSAVCLHLET